MKKLILISALGLCPVWSWCQSGVSSLSENFDVDCVSGSGIPVNWYYYTPTHLGTIPLGEWTCTSVNGRGGTPGMQCSGTYSSTYHLDTSFLVTPLLDLSSYTGNVYIQFDTKTSNIVLGDTLTAEVVDYPPNPDSAFHVSLSSSMTPVFGNDDSTNWVTHVANLTSFKASPFYVAFRYTSPATSGNTWYLDNVYIRSYNVTLGIAGETPGDVLLSISSPQLANQVNYTCSSPDPGIYRVALVDVTGRIIVHEQVYVSDIPTSHSLSVPSLSQGIYFLKIGNERTFGATKVAIR